VRHHQRREYAAYAFDFDGTLAGTAEANHRAVHASLAAHGITVPLSRVRAESVFTAAELRRRFHLAPADLPEDTFAAAARAHWFAHTDQIRPIAAATTAARAAARYAALAVVSANYSDIVRHGRSLVGLDDLPWTVVGRADIPHTKPAPDAYLRAARFLGVDPRDVLAHEDTDEGITAAGMDVIDVRQRPWT